jgi:hypothetical protein
MKIKKIISVLILTLTLSISSTEIQAQCPMCKMSAESNLNHGGASGKGLNFGILYMLSLPYVIVGTVGYIWYRNRRKEDELVPEIDSFSNN